MDIIARGMAQQAITQTTDIAYIQKNTIALLGDSIMDINGKGDDILTSEPIYYDALATGCFTWANVLLGQRLKLIGNFGIGGNSTAQIFARVGDVIAAKPAYCIVLGGTNDAVANWDTSLTKSNLIAIYQALINAGITVVAMTMPPRDDLSDALKTKLMECNNYIRGLRSSLKNYIVCDIYEVLANAANNNYASNLASDGIHPTVQGAYQMGVKLYDIFNNLIPPISVFTGGNLDANNPFANPYMLGGATVATGWSVMTSVAYTASKVARTNGLEWQQIDITEGSGGLVQLYQHISSGFAVGDKVHAYIEYEIDTGATLIDRYMAFMSAVDGDYTQKAVGYGLYLSDSGGVRFPQAITKGIIRTPRFTIPATTAGLQLWAAFTLKGKFRLGRTRVIKE